MPRVLVGFFKSPGCQKEHSDHLLPRPGTQGSPSSHPLPRGQVSQPVSHSGGEVHLLSQPHRTELPSAPRGGLPQGCCPFRRHRVVTNPPVSRAPLWSLPEHSVPRAWSHPTGFQAVTRARCAAEWESLLSFDPPKASRGPTLWPEEPQKSLGPASLGVVPVGGCCKYSCDGSLSAGLYFSGVNAQQRSGWAVY